MNAFTMQVDYLDPETGELTTYSILVDDFGYKEAEPFQPEPDSNTESLW